MATRAVNILLNATDKASPKIGKVRASLSGLTSVINPLTGALAGLTAGFSAAAATKWAVGLAADFEQVQVSFTTMLKDGRRANALLKEISDFAASTPFQFDDLTDASKKLLAFGESAENVVPTLKRIGDVSSGIGAPIGEIAEIYGKARVQGRLFAQDINQLTGRGIPIIQELAKQFRITDGEVKKLVESGQVDFANLEQAFISLTSSGGQFAGLMAAQSGTLSGLWSTLKDQFSLVARQIGQELLPYLKIAVEDLLKLTNGFNEAGGAGESFGNTTSSAFRKLAGTTQAAADGFEGFVFLFRSVRLAVDASAFAVAGLTEGLARLLDPIGQLLGTNNAFVEWARNWRQEMTRLVQDDWANVMESVNEPWPSDGMEAYFRDFESRVAELREKMKGLTSDVQFPSVTGGGESGGVQPFTGGQSPTGDVAGGMREVVAGVNKSMTTTLQAEAKRLFEATRTPAERFNIELSKIAKLYGQGLISLDTSNRAIADARQKAHDAFRFDQPEDTARGTTSITSTVSRTLTRGAGFSTPGHQQIQVQRDLARKAEQQRKAQLKETQELRRLLASIDRKSAPAAGF